MPWRTCQMSRCFDNPSILAMAILDEQSFVTWRTILGLRRLQVSTNGPRRCADSQNSLEQTSYPFNWHCNRTTLRILCSSADNLLLYNNRVIVVITKFVFRRGQRKIETDHVTRFAVPFSRLRDKYSDSRLERWILANRHNSDKLVNGSVFSLIRLFSYLCVFSFREQIFHTDTLTAMRRHTAAIKTRTNTHTDQQLAQWRGG